ncbi:MAG TPA: HAMP domain-containing sensor histidine kinase [Ktedonobacterales bacterium]|nr:HAMP domain-containing sensor histidine kinase [Ktedonobacterales bacterium]
MKSRACMRGVVERVRTWGEQLPLRWRLALVTFALLALLLGALGGLISFTEQHALLANQAAALYNEGQLAASVHVDSDVLAHRLAGANTGVMILLPDGTNVTPTSSTPELEAPAQVTISSSDLQRALNDRAPDTYTYLVERDTTGQRQLVVLFPVYISYQGAPTTALLILHTPTAPIDHAVVATRLILTIGMFAALAIAAALIFPLVNTALRPLRTMEQASRRIADGALSLRLEPPPAHDEIGNLARSFNIMVARLEETFARQKRFVADAAHELRTPLTALGGGLEMLLMGADRGDVEASRRLMRGMYAETERMRRLVEDLLTLTRLDEGRAGLRLERIELGPLLEDVTEQARQLAKGQEIRCDVAEGLPPVRADADRVRQVLLNVVENALKFTPAPGNVELVARPAKNDAGGGVAVEVRDTGAGISADALPHVFDRFYRADPARARAGTRPGGSGLGLAIAKSLVEAQGGTISIASKEGAGTAITIVLPAWRD